MGTWRTWVPIGLILIVACGLRVSTITQGTNVDEGDYILQGREMVLGHWPHADVHLNKPPLVSFIAYPFFWFSEIPIIPIRVFMILASVSAVFAIYWLGARLFSQTAGLCAAAMLALDPMTAIWAKALHVSTLTPILSVWVLALLAEGCASQKRRWFIASGFVFALALFNKQTGVVIAPVIAAMLGASMLGWIKDARSGSNKASITHALWWCVGVIPLWLLFGMYLLFMNAIEPFVYDIWSSNLRMADAFDQDAVHRWGEFQAMVFWNPWVWLLALGGVVVSLLRFHHAAGLILCLWLGIEWYVNLFALSHYWTHYTMAVTVPAALLAGVLLGQIAAWGERFSAKLKPFFHWGAVALVVLLTITYWPRANWPYPNLTLEEERGIAAFVDRQFDSQYLLCFANTTFYMWTDTQVPPSIRGDREVRIPPFMNTAARGYLTLDDMHATADHWRTLPIEFCIMYGKYYRQIFIDKDPLLEPIRTYLEERFEFQQRFVYRPTYMAELYCFRAKAETD